MIQHYFLGRVLPNLSRENALVLVQLWLWVPASDVLEVVA